MGLADVIWDELRQDGSTTCMGFTFYSRPGRKLEVLQVSEEGNTILI